jgi:hypothetical protein
MWIRVALASGHNPLEELAMEQECEFCGTELCECEPSELEPRQMLRAVCIAVLAGLVIWVAPFAAFLL